MDGELNQLPQSTVQPCNLIINILNHLTIKLIAKVTLYLLNIVFFRSTSFPQNFIFILVWEKKGFSLLVALTFFCMLLVLEYSPYSIKKKAIGATAQPTKTLPLNHRVIVDRSNCLCNIYTPPAQDMPPQNSGPSVTASHSFDHKRLYNK